ncbi:head maturation protease, ClpP-related [Lysinibacillus sp. NPDC047702]|uniref:head maturation protease, ClpP-related n=1 Tax=unclassified Lysinibacillus TaxID=2636778 RepID=UPI003D0150EC
MKKIEIKGHIVPDDHLIVYQWFGYTATSPNLVKNAIAEAEALGETELLVEINSGGGSVWAGAEMYYALKKFNGTVRGEIPSIAASAATFPAMACDHLAMSLLGQMMIHRAKNGIDGNQQDMRNNADFLKNIDDSIVSAYLTKTSLSREELNEMMKKDSWMTAQQAHENKFIDEILFANEAPDAVASAAPLDNSTLLPQDVIDKVKAEILASKQATSDPLNSVEPQNQTKEDSLMNLETLQNEHPELFNQVKQLGYDEGQQAENARIAEIEELATPGNEALVTAAKQDLTQNAATLAVAIVKAEKAKGANFLTNREADAETVNAVPATQEDPIDTASADAKLAAELKNIWGGNQ